MKILALVLLAVAPGVALAQDVQPVFSLPDLAQGQVISSTAKGYAGRGSAARPHGHEAMSDAQYCASIPKYRRTLGAHSEKVRRLTALCKQAGYSTGD